MRSARFGRDRKYQQHRVWLNPVGRSQNYASLTDFQRWGCTVAMLLGRLELFTLLIIFTPAFWRR